MVSKKNDWSVDYYGAFMVASLLIQMITDSEPKTGRDDEALRMIAILLSFDKIRNIYAT